MGSKAILIGYGLPMKNFQLHMLNSSIYSLCYLPYVISTLCFAEKLLLIVTAPTGSILQHFCGVILAVVPPLLFILCAHCDALLIVIALQ